MYLPPSVLSQSGPPKSAGGGSGGGVVYHTACGQYIEVATFFLRPGQTKSSMLASENFMTFLRVSSSTKLAHLNTRAVVEVSSVKCLGLCCIAMHSFSPF